MLRELHGGRDGNMQACGCVNVVPPKRKSGAERGVKKATETTYARDAQ